MLNSFKSNPIQNVNAQYITETDDPNKESFLNPSLNVTISNAQKIAVVYSCIRIKMNDCF